MYATANSRGSGYQKSDPETDWRCGRRIDGRRGGLPPPCPKTCAYTTTKPSPSLGGGYYPPKFFSRKGMKGGNEATIGSVVTLCSKGEIPFCVAENAPRMAPVSGRLAVTGIISFAESPPPLRADRMSANPRIEAAFHAQMISGGFAPARLSITYFAPCSMSQSASFVIPYSQA